MSKGIIIEVERDLVKLFLHVLKKTEEIRKFRRIKIHFSNVF